MDKTTKLDFPGLHFLGVLLTGTWNYWNVEQYRRSGKRMWDTGSALVILSFIWPLFVIIAILIKIDSKGSVFFTQNRIGKDGKIFKLYKFRTMVCDADNKNPRTEENDCRITRVGKLIRRISLDELPQLINIIKGDMSFIGPRPLSQEEIDYAKDVENLPQSTVEKLTPKVRPGILGWAIFQGREKISYQDRYKYNKEYEDKYSLLFDSYISWLTAKKYWISYLVVILLFITIPTIIIYSL